MRVFWHRFCTNLNWFLGTLIVLVVIAFLIWRAVDYDGCVSTINGWMRDLWEIFSFMFAIVISIVGLAIILGWRPFKSKAKKGGGH